MNYADYTLVRPIAHTTHGPILLVTDSAGQYRSLRFLSLDEHAANEARLAVLLETKFTQAANVLDTFKQPQRVGVVCEYVEGQTLADLLLIPGAIKPNFADFIATGLQSALREMHDLGLFHGDLTPANIVITSQGQVKLIDFATVTQGTPGYRLPGAAVGAESDLYAFEKICQQLGAAVPQPAGVGGLSPAALLRADLAREHTVAAAAGSGSKKISRGRHTRPKRSFPTFLRQTFNLRVTLGFTLLVLGASSFGYWMQGSAQENVAVQGSTQENVAVQEVPAQNLLPTGGEQSQEVASEQPCMSPADAESIIRSLLKQRNEALAQLDVRKLDKVYVADSHAAASDLALFKRLDTAGEVVNGLRSEISDLQVVSCGEVVTLRLQHRLLEHERCNAKSCQIVPVGAPRWEKISLVGPSWRIKEIKVGE